MQQSYDTAVKMSLFVYFIDTPLPLLSRRPQYPATLCKLEFLDEGGANIVYRIIVANETHTSARLNNKLLRLRKNVRHSRPVAEQLQAYEGFRVLFPKQHLLDHELVRLDDGVVAALNELLRKRVRPSHRAQDFLYQDERHGVLITDMTPKTNEVLVQLKPKWLLQSPNAPQDATRCRTCALRAQRKAKNTATATDGQEACPLMLISPSEKDRLATAEKLCPDAIITAYLSHDAQSLLQSLRDYQSQFDKRGMLLINGVNEIMALCRAMTLRDCTLYVRRREDNILEARLGDLDMKQPEKLTAWRKQEQALIDEGWYTNTENTEGFRREYSCLLSRWITT